MDAVIDGYRLPAEWERQSGILLAWPHAATDWRDNLSAIQSLYVQLIKIIQRFEPVVVCVPDGDEATRLHELVSDSTHSHPIYTVIVDYDDTWVRDSGPLTLLSNGQRLWLDCRFDGWGGKFAAAKDDQLVGALAKVSLFGQIQLKRMPWVLEGGAIESDGQGNILTTSQCIKCRWSKLDRHAASQRLLDALGARRIHWLDHGALPGDDTDGHIDLLARFAPKATIVYQGCQRPGDPLWGSFDRMVGQLACWRANDGKPFRLIELPMPSSINGPDGPQPAGYANFLILNGAVLMPTYDDPADPIAARALQQAFPDHQIVALDSRPLIAQGGGPHCATMQLPDGFRL